MRSPSLSRRRFLRGAATLAAAPYVLPRLVKGATAPSERLNLGLIGLGNMCDIHLGSILKNRQVQIVAACDVKAPRRQWARERIESAYRGEQRAGFRGVALYNEFERILQRSDIDAVLIAVPDHWHALIAVAACETGKDVYCEKPLSLTIAEADEMVAAARRYGRVFQTGSQQRSDPLFRKACALVRSGRIGEIQQVNVGVGGASAEAYLPEEPVPEGFDYDRWLGPAPMAPYNAERVSGSFGGGWRQFRDYSGWLQTDWGAHHYDIAQWGLGMDGTGPVEIIPPNASEHGELEYRYASGLPMLRGGAHGILFTGSDGRIEVNRGHFRTWPADIGREPLRPDDVHLYETDGHFENWVACVRSRRKPICDVAIGASSVTVCHLGNIATWVGRKLKWDPEQHEFIGDDLANRWLSRPYRSPWRL